MPNLIEIGQPVLNAGKDVEKELNAGKDAGKDAEKELNVENVVNRLLKKFKYI